MNCDMLKMKSLRKGCKLCSSPLRVKEKATSLQTHNEFTDLNRVTAIHLKVPIKQRSDSSEPGLVMSARRSR